MIINNGLSKDFLDQREAEILNYLSTYQLGQ